MIRTKSPAEDALVSTLALHEGIARVEAEAEKQKRLRSDTDPFFRHVRWVLDEWRVSMRQAEQEYRPTVETAELTGWSQETLRRHAKALHEGKTPPREWAGMVARRNGGDYAFQILTIPVKRTHIRDGEGSSTNRPRRSA